MRVKFFMERKKPKGISGTGHASHPGVLSFYKVGTSERHEKGEMVCEDLRRQTGTPS